MFTCKRCKHVDMMHFLFTGYCIERGCDCLSMDGLFDAAWKERAAADRADTTSTNTTSTNTIPTDSGENV